MGLVGEALGEDEARLGGVFQGSAGWMLNRVFNRGGFKREDFAFIDNTLHCRPPNNKLSGEWYAPEAIRRCAHFLDDTIAQTQPQALVALGGTALSRLAGQSGITRNRGFVFETNSGIPVVGTFHPSFLLPRKKEKANSKYTWVMIMDIRKALRIAQGKRNTYPQHYLLDPHPDKAREFIGEYERTPGVKLAWDLETLYKLQQKNEQKLVLENKQTITRISFAFRPGYAMTVPHTPEYLEKVILPLMRMNRPKVGWNVFGFDLPIVTFQEGWEVNGVMFDGMDQFHLLQPNIERNLEFATSILADHLSPWKHLSQAEPEFYSCVDSDATITDVVMLDQIMAEREVPSYV